MRRQTVFREQPMYREKKRRQEGFLDALNPSAHFFLAGEIDWNAAGDGVMVSKDGFRATTVGPDELHALTAGLGSHVRITEVDNSSVFCEIVK